MPRNLFGKTLSHDSGSLVPLSQTMAFSLIANLSGDTILTWKLRTDTPPKLIPKEMGKLRLLSDEGHMLIIEWSLTWIEAPLRLPCCSLYINQSLLMSFIYFLLKSIIRAHLSSLSDNTVQLLHSSYIFSPSTFNLVSILVNSSSIFLLQTLYVSVIPYKLVKVIGFTVTCRSCLVRRVTIRLSAME